MAAAKHIGVRTGWALWNLDIQKLVYIANMMHVDEQGKPLVFGLFEASLYGPIHSKLFDELEMFGAKPVKAWPFRATTLPDRESLAAKTLDRAVDQFAHDPARLTAITHHRAGAWSANVDVKSAASGVSFKNKTISFQDVQAECERRRRAAQTAKPEPDPAAPAMAAGGS